jgi:DNA-binding transcriptional ArsR family regulator
MRYIGIFVRIYRCNYGILQIMQKGDNNKQERILKAFANRRRLEILSYLKRRNEASVSDIARNIKLSFRSTSHHLRILAASDIIEKEQRKLHIFYKIARLQPDLAARIMEIF